MRSFALSLACASAVEESLWRLSICHCGGIHSSSSSSHAGVGRKGGRNGTDRVRMAREAKQRRIACVCVCVCVWVCTRVPARARACVHEYVRACVRTIVEACGRSVRHREP